MTANEIMNKFNISNATLRNWKKLGYIDNINDIDPKIIEKIIKEKKVVRRNKKNSTDNIIPTSYIDDKRIINIIEKIIELKNEYNISDNEILIEAIHLLIKNNNKNIPKEIEKILGKRTSNRSFKNKFRNIEFKYDTNNDFLGCLYMSLLSIGKKDTDGIFYTPFKVVNKIVESIDISEKSKIIDPGCGSGNFIIQTFKKMKKQNIDTETIINNLYGYDIDKIAVLLAKVNIYILEETIKYKYINIYNKDFLNDDENIKFDIIIGNPPWGKKYTKNEKKILEKKYGKSFAKQDSFSQFILKSFKVLNNDGVLGFVLPSSILNIAVHQEIRKFLLDYDIKYIKEIGREFEEIVTDVIIIKVEKKQTKNNKCIYNNNEILQSSFKQNTNYNFLISSNIATDIITKLRQYKHTNLNNNNITYALGIVTGNNKKFICDKSNKKNEPIISGKEITKYNIDYSKINKYIEFNKNKFQQVAKEELYRNKNKIIYKFIGRKLSFSVEKKGYLTLNSANIICFNNDEDIFYISAILNSRITQLFFEEIYNTHKLLKNHIQSFIIPNFKDETKTTISKLSKNAKPTNTYNEKIEDIIYEKLRLTTKEIEYLKGRFH